MRPRLLARLGFLSLFALASAASAETAPQGSGTLAGGERLRVPGCGRERRPVSLDVTLAPTGEWAIDDGTTEYTGTSTAIRRRVARLTFDAASLAALDAKLEADATALCHEAVTIRALDANAALVVNKRQTRAALLVRARATGTSAGGSRERGRYRVRAAGSWNGSSN